MRGRTTGHPVWILVAALVTGCAATSGSPAAPDLESELEAAGEPEKEPARLVGETGRAEIESVRPEWIEETVASSPDAEVAAALLEVEPAALTVFLGTWCSDSRRELARFWRALDGLPYEPPLEIRYVAVDRAKDEPAALVAGVDLRFVPTFVVSRDGGEIGRVIEEAPAGIESDLLDLLTGRSSGWISARDDLDATAEEAH